MQLFEIEADSTGNVIHVMIEDTRTSDGSGLTGLRSDSSGLSCYYMRAGQRIPYCAMSSSSMSGDTGPDQIVLAESCPGQWVEGGFVEIDATTFPGLYELQLPDACVADGSHTCRIILRGADYMAATNVAINIRPAVVDANIHSISDDTSAADNLEATYDGTGYIDPKAPARQEQINNIATTGSAVNAAATTAVFTLGAEVGDYTNTTGQDETYHEIVNDTGEIDFYYEFDVGADGVPTSYNMRGHLNFTTGVTQDIDVYAYNWDATTWEQIGIFRGVKNSTSSDDSTYAPVLFLQHVGTGANAGKVRVRFYGTGMVESSDLFIDQTYVSYAVVRRTVGYANGAIWVDTINGTAGTETFINGTADNPVDTWADALSLAASLHIYRFELIGASSITLTGSVENYWIRGADASVALNGQTIDGAYFEGCFISGTGIGSAETARFLDCVIQTCTLPACSIGRCAIAATLTLSQAGTYLLEGCFSGVAGSGSPTIDFGAAVGNTALNMRHYSGGVSIENMGQSGSDTMSLEGYGQLKIQASCVGGEIVVRGNFRLRDYTVSGFAGTLTDIARFGTDQLTSAVAEAWDVTMSEHVAEGTTGKALSDVTSNVDTMLRSHHCRFVPSIHAPNRTR